MTYLKLLLPRFWIRNHLTNWSYNKWLKAYLKTNPKIDLSKSDSFIVYFEDGNALWIANFPYSFGSKVVNQTKFIHCDKLPSRCTCIKLFNYLDKNDYIVAETEESQKRLIEKYRKRAEKEIIDKYKKDI